MLEGRVTDGCVVKRFADLRTSSAMDSWWTPCVANVSTCLRSA